MDILIVDDKKFHALDIEMALIDSGFTDIVSVSSVEEAFERIEIKAPQLAYIDLQLSNSSGYELVPKLKSFGTYVFIVTGFPENSNVNKSIELEIDGFLTKPVSIEEIQFHTRRVLNEINKGSQHFFYSNNKIQKIRITDIQYLQAEGNYTSIYLKDRKIVMKRSLKGILSEISSGELIQVFRSIAVNKDCIKLIDFKNSTVETDFDKMFILGRAYRKDIKSKFNYKGITDSILKID